MSCKPFSKNFTNLGVCPHSVKENKVIETMLLVNQSKPFETMKEGKAKRLTTLS